MKFKYLYDSGASSPSRGLTSGSQPLRSRAAGRFGRLLLLALVVCALWLTIEDRWGSDFVLPTRYTGDAHYILAMMKLAKEGDLGLFTHITTASLGAPFRGQLNDFIEAERVIVWLGGQVARVTGLMPASNIMLILACVGAAFSFYFAARLWRVSRLTAWVFAIVYAFLPHNQRSLDSLGIVTTGLLPLQFYCLWYIATVQRLSWKSFRFRLTLVIGMLSGLLNVYWVFFFAQMCVLAVLCGLLKRRQGVIMALIPLAATCFMAILVLGSFVIYRFQYGVNPTAMVRTYSDVEGGALKPIELLIPIWGTRLKGVSLFFSRYYDGGKWDVGEYWWGVYIGLCAIAGLLALLFRGVYRQLNRHSPSLPFLAVCWTIAYASFGGVNAIFSLITNFYDIRGTNRYSFAIATIGFLYFVFVIHRLTKRWSLKVRFGVLIALGSLFMWDQSYQSYFFPRYNIPTSLTRERVMADKALALNLENRLDAGAMIYILPVLDFPEPFSGRGAFKLNFFIYDPIRPFLYSTKLRYSYGSNKGRQGADWQLNVQELPAGELAARLESYGFAGILLNRKDYPDRGEQLLAEFAKAGWPMEFEQGIRNEWAFIRLRPSERPVFPTQTPYAMSVENQDS
ncbi:hypothetical protein [Cephaloticoccus primus]|nr:hypothetical protein [Cephaloticoccus primus]